MALLLIVLGIAGIFLASEYLMSHNSRWDVLKKKYGNAGAPPNGWRACKFLRIEVQEGNRLRITSYGHGYKKDTLDFLTAKLFPKALVSASPAGLYLKRQPWNFLHPPILIPWGRVSSAQSLAGSDFVAQAAGRQMPVAGLAPKIPGVFTGIVNALTGEVIELRLADPNMRLQVPAAAVGDVAQYLKAKPNAPVKQPSLVGAV
jgi:hypothetical protein